MSSSVATQSLQVNSAQSPSNAVWLVKNASSSVTGQTPASEPLRPPCRKGSHAASLAPFPSMGGSSMRRLAPPNPMRRRMGSAEAIRERHGRGNPEAKLARAITLTACRQAVRGLPPWKSPRLRHPGPRELALGLLVKALGEPQLDDGLAVHPRADAVIPLP